MKFSVMLPQTNRIASPEALIRAAEMAEALDFHAVSVQDHIVFNGVWITSGMRGLDLPGDDRNIFEAMETLAFVASRTSRLRLGTSVLIVPNRHPLLLAKQISSLDVLSAGRVIFGAGVGPNRAAAAKPSDQVQLGRHRSNLEKAYDAFGASGSRGPRMDEYIRAMIAIWTEERPSFDGEFVHFDEVDVFPKPIQKPYPPMLIGGRSEAAQLRVIEYADGWIPSQVTADEIRSGLANIRAGRTAAGRRADLAYVGVNLHSAIADSDEAAEAIAHPTVGHLFGDMDAFRSRTITGSVDTFRDRVLEYRDAGVTYVELKPVYRDLDHLEAQLRLIRDEVMPAVADPIAA